MADPLQALMQLVQDGGQGAPPPAAGSQPDMMAKLAALVGGGGSAPMAPPMPSPDAVNPMSRAIQNYTGPRAQQPGGYADDALDVPEGTAPNDPASGRMPGQRNMGAYLHANDPGPVIGSEYGPANAGRDRIPGQQNMGAYLNANKPMSTQEELDDVSNKMGGTPEENGDFPSQKEINALNAGKINPKDFDRKWGKGAAAEMMNDGNDKESDSDADDGDHEYR